MVWVVVLAQGGEFAAAGMKALEEKKYEEAAAAFRKAVEVEPGDYAAQFHLALSLSMLGRDGEAIADYTKVLELKPGLFEAELNLGILLLRQKQPREAAGRLRAAAESKPGEYRPVFYLGEALLAAGEAAPAALAYEKALALDAKSAAAELGLGRALMRQERLDAAAPHFRRAAELDPAFRDALLELAAQFEARNKAAEATAIYEQFPENAAAQERLGELLLEADKPADAVPHLEAAAAKSPTPANRFALAMAYLKSKQSQKGLALLDQAVAADGSNVGLRMAYGRALRDERNFQAAAREFWWAAKLKPDLAEAWSELAGMLILLESYPQAIAALDRVRVLGAEKPAHMYFRAVVLDRSKQYKPALQSYQRFLEASGGKNPDEEFKARQRIRVIQKELSKR